MSFIHDIYEFTKSFRHIEKLTLRCVHLKNAVEFNETCLNNGIFSNYFHIYIYIKHVLKHCFFSNKHGNRLKSILVIHRKVFVDI